MTIHPMWVVERRAIIAAVIECGRVDLAAKKLQMGRATVYRKLRQYAEDQYVPPTDLPDPPVFLQLHRGVLHIKDRATHKTLQRYRNNRLRNEATSR